jgi:uncharacterized OB-fold protein
MSTTSDLGRYFPDAMPNPAASPETKPFWDAALEHRLVLQRCASCGRFRHPPRALCPWCRSFEATWDDVAGAGTLFTWSVVHQPFHPVLRDVVPYIVGIVEIDGTDGTRITTNIVDTPHDQLRAGLRVEVVWEDMSPELAVPRFRAAG